MRPAIETHDLVKRFRELTSYRDLLTLPWRAPEHVAVDGISLAIRPGELFGVLGPNGAGKTTLIRMLSSSLLPTAGSATVAGFDVVRETAQVRAAIGLVGGEERSFYPRLTGRQNLEFFAALRRLRHDEARRRADELLALVGLGEDADRRVERYSAGMRQKLAVARGLLGDPQVLFLDEPTRALDPVSARDVRRFVREHVVGELRRTVLLATHSMPEAEALCDRIALVDHGRVLECGTVDELRRALFPRVHCELRVRELPPALPDALRALPGVLEVEVDAQGPLPTLRLALGEDGAILAAVLRETVEAGAEVHGCSTRAATLEEIYLLRLAPQSAAEPVAT